MAQDTNVENLIINKLTKAQYESITNPDPTQLYFITDEVISSADVISALGYTPYNATNPSGYISSATIASLTDVDLTGLADGQVLKYNSTAQKWENSTVGGGTWGSITGTLSDQTDLQTALDAKYDASNPSGFITGITSSDVTNALGYTPYNSTNPNGYITISALNGYATETWVTNQGYITGITSSDVTTALGYTPYNATNPNGYITASALTGYATETYVDTGLATKQATLVSGTNIKTINNTSLLGSGDITITSAPDIDNKSITTNSDGELQTVGVIDQNNTTNAIKTWTGTKAQYDAIVTKDSNTLYNIIDDTDVTLPLLELLFPVGAVYFGTMSVCPLQVLGVGTWQALPQDKVIQIAGTRGSVGDTLNESLPNIIGSTQFGNISNVSYPYAVTDTTGAFYGSNQGSVANVGVNQVSGYNSQLDFDASRSSSTYQNDAPVQQDAYLLNGWRRIS